MDTVHLAAYDSQLCSIVGWGTYRPGLGVWSTRPAQFG